MAPDIASDWTGELRTIAAWVAFALLVGFGFGLGAGLGVGLLVDQSDVTFEVVIGGV